MDTGGHGTHVAGTIGAQGNNDMGIVGVAWEASLMALRFLGPFGGSTSGAIGAINYATMMKRDYDINVAATNNSWGGGGYNQALADAIVAGVDANILFVAAAGNFSNNNDVIPFYPTNYDVPGLISVAATNRNNNMAGFSHYGRTTVDIGAPGVEILSTIPGNGYAAFQGTSMAAPHVSGVAALLSAAYPQATVSQLKAAILGSAVPIPSLTGRTLTGGLLNAKNALDWMNHGTVAGGGQVRFVTNGDIDLATAAGSLVVEGTAGSVKLDQVGDVTIAATGLTADDVEIVIDGSMVLGQGAITANTLAVTATNDIDVLTDVTTLSAISESGYVSVIETNGLELVGDGIVADSDVTLVLESGSLVDGGLTIIGDSLLVDLRGAGDIDLKTVANQLSAKTFSGNIVIENVGSFAVGDDGILADDGTAGDAVFNDVTLKSTGGSIGAGVGTVSASFLTADADGAIALTTEVADLTASALAGDISVTQSNVDLSVTSAIASGSVSISSEDAQMDVFVVQAGSTGDVTLTTTGVAASTGFASDMTLAESSVIAGGTATLTSAGDMTGDLGLEAGDVVAETIILESNGDTGIAVSAETDRLTATALGSTATTLEIVQVNDSPVFIGGGTNPTNLSSAGSISFESARTTEDADGLFGNDIIVLDTPDYDAPPTGAGTLTYSTVTSSIKNDTINVAIVTSSLICSNQIVTDYDAFNSACWIACSNVSSQYWVNQNTCTTGTDNRVPTDCHYRAIVVFANDNTVFVA